MRLIKSFFDFLNEHLKRTEDFLNYEDIIPGMSGVYVFNKHEIPIEIEAVFKCSDLSQQQIYDIANEYEGAEYLADLTVADIESLLVKNSYIFITTAGPNSTQEHYAYIMPSADDSDILIPASEKWKQSNKLKDVSNKTGLLESVKFNKLPKKEGKKTDIYNVIKDKTIIGQIKWSSRARGYAFLPTADCDDEIKEFVKDLMVKRRLLKKK